MSPWWIVPGLILSLFLVGILVEVNWCRPARRKTQLRKPAKVWFKEGLGPDRNELHVPAHSDDSLVQIHYQPTLDYEETAIHFGLEGDEDKRPVPFAMRNAWVKRGRRKDESPDDNPDHIINIKDRYEARCVRPRSTDHEYTIGFRIRTRDPGRYKVILYIFAEEREGLPDKELYVVVK